MPEIKNQAQIEEMRRRLYERGNTTHPEARHDMTANNDIVPRSWVTPPPIPQPTAFDPRPVVLKEPTVAVHEPAPAKKRGWSYRTIILLVTLGLFLAALGASSLYLVFGNTQISNKNISLTVTGPLTVGGGETMPINVGITNQNKASIESVVLIMKYPAGTKSAEDPSKDLYEDRVTLNSIKPGESITVPVKAVMFGEENEEHQVNATVEYHLVDSNGTFYKDADPLTFKINSSPLVISVDALNKVSAGQSTEVTLTIKSNATAPLQNLLISANYPNNFDFTSAEPAPAYRESEWTIKELKPGESQKIVIKGDIVGQQAETFQMQFSAGTAEKNNEFTIGSVLAKASTDFVIEQPFIDVGVAINANPKASVVTLQTGDETRVTVTVQNTLEESLYDMALEVGVKGNILVREAVEVKNGFYDSVKDVVRFDPSGDSTLLQVAPGAKRTFTFTLKPSAQKSTPSFMVTANTYARRVNEARATEHLVGTAKTEVKFTSSVTVARTIARKVPGFTDSGPLPPVADTETTYTVTLDAGAGGNDVAGAVVVTSLPQYVNWKNLSSGDGILTFNPISKELTWNVGDIDAGQVKHTTFQIGLLPSQNQIGTTPAVLGTQRLRATDRFTGEVIRAENVPASSELGPESGLEAENGKVLKTAL